MPTQVSLLDGALASAGTLAIQTNGTTSAITISSAQVATFVNNPIMTGLTASRAVFTDGSKGLTSNAITGTGNVVMSASPTLTGTIDGAALTLSSSLTLSGGTANGVAYLNGSKVLTTGSALTFDGSQFYVNSNSTTASGFFQINDATTTQANSFGTIVRNANDGNGRYSLSAWRAQNASGLTQYSYIGTQSISGAANYTPEMVFGLSTGASSYAEQMRLTTTGLGIGTSSPNSKLNVNNGFLQIDISGTQAVRVGSSDSIVGGTTNNAVIQANTSKAITFLAGGTETARIDGAGNLGLGVTPSAWVSTFKAFQVGTGGTFYGDYNNTTSYFGNNAYFNGSAWKYVSSSYALYAYQDRSAGKHVWAVAASGTAGNNITWTEALTLDASGNLLLGTTSSDARLNIKGSGSTSSTFSLIVRNSASGDIVKTRDDGFVFLPSTYNNTSASAANVFMGGSGELYRSTSSLKYKTNVQDATHGLADLLKLRSVTYQGKSEADAGKTFGGLIAEEVDAAGLTEFVQYAEDGSPDALAYGNMVSLCIKAIQEQQAIIEQLTSRIAALETK